MSTKGTHIRIGCRFRSRASRRRRRRRAGSVSHRQLARDPARVSRQDAAVQQRLRDEREDPGLSRSGEARQIPRRLRAHQGGHAVPVGDRPRVLSPVRAGVQSRQVRRSDLHPRRRAVPGRPRPGAAARRRQGRSAERQESGRRRVRSGRTQRGLPARASGLCGHHLREIAQGRRPQSRRHSRLGAPAARARP
jgi:hypothetical protein